MTPSPNLHRKVQRLHERAEHLHTAIVHDLVQPAGEHPSLAVRQVAELSERLSQSLATCLATLSVENDVELWRQLDPAKGRRVA